MKNLNVNALVKILGINPHTLRGWERRYGAVTPKRDKEGRRLYSSKDIERIQYLMELVDKGHFIGQIAGMTTQELKRMNGQESIYLDKSRSETLEKNENKNFKLVDEIIFSLEKFKLNELNINLNKARFHMGIRELINNLIYPLMVKVGNLVEVKKLNIAQEHMLSSLLRDFLGTIHQSLNPYEQSTKIKTKKILICTREGDIHEFGILISSIICNFYRYQNFYLGTNLPANELSDAAAQFDVDIVLLGVMKLPPEKEQYSTLAYLKNIDKRLPQKVSFIIGGSDLAEAKMLKTSRKIYFISEFLELEKILMGGI